MRVLLVDHDSKSLEAVSRAMRGVIQLDSANNKADALMLLKQHSYDVMIACERLTDGSGLDLLGRTNKVGEGLQRIFAAAPERLQLLGPRLAPFKVARTISYPIAIEELWLALAAVTSGEQQSIEGTVEHVVLDAGGASVRTPNHAKTAATPRSAPAAVAVTVAASTRLPTPNATASMASGRGRAAVAAAMPELEPPPPVTRPTAKPAPANRRPAAWTPSQQSDPQAAAAAQATFAAANPSAKTAKRSNKTLPLVGAVAVALAVLAAGTAYLLGGSASTSESQSDGAEPTAGAARTVASQPVSAADPADQLQQSIESALMRNDLQTARAALAELARTQPTHSRLGFLTSAVQRAAEQVGMTPAAAVESSLARTATTAPAVKSNESQPSGSAAAGSAAIKPNSSPSTDASTNAATSFAGRTLEEAATAPSTRKTRAPATAAAANSSKRSTVVTPLVNSNAAIDAQAVPAPFVASETVVGAKLVKRVAPQYPTRAAQDGLEGYVLLDYLVTDTGRVIDVKITESQPSRVFDRVARDAVRRWKYLPQTVDGKPVEVRMNTRIDFKLAD
jgi:TonB family protein